MLLRFPHWSEQAVGLFNAATLIGFLITLGGGVFPLARLLSRRFLRNKDTQIARLRKNLAQKEMSF